MGGYSSRIFVISGLCGEACFVRLCDNPWYSLVVEKGFNRRDAKLCTARSGFL